MTLDFAPPTVHSSSNELSQCLPNCLYASNTSLSDTTRYRKTGSPPRSPYAPVRKMSTRPSRSRRSPSPPHIPKPHRHVSRWQSDCGLWRYALFYAVFLALWPISVAAMPTPAAVYQPSQCATCIDIPPLVPRQLSSQSLPLSTVEPSSIVTSASAPAASPSSERSEASVPTHSAQSSQDEPSTGARSSSIPPTSQSSQEPPTTQPSQEPPTSQPSKAPSMSQPSQAPPTSQPSQAPPTTHSSQVPPTTISTQIAPASRSSQVAPASEPSRAPPESRSSQAPPASRSSQVAPVSQSSQAPPLSRSSQAHPESQSTQEPPTLRSSQVPPTSISTQVAPVSRSSQVSPESQSSQAPSTSRSSQVPTTLPPPTSASSMPPTSQSVAPPSSRPPTSVSSAPSSASSEPSSARSQPPTSAPPGVSPTISPPPSSLSSSEARPISVSSPPVSISASISASLSVSLSIPGFGPSSSSSLEPSSAPPTSASSSVPSSGPSTSLTLVSSSSATSSSSSTTSDVSSSAATSVSVSSSSTGSTSSSASSSAITSVSSASSSVDSSSSTTFSSTGSTSSTTSSSDVSSSAGSISSSAISSTGSITSARPSSTSFIPSSTPPPLSSSNAIPSSSSPQFSPTASLSSRPLFPASSTPTPTTPEPVQTSASGTTTVLTTIVTVVTSVYTTSGSIRATTIYTTAIATGTLIPNGGSSNNRNALAHNPGAIAGLVIGIVAFFVLIGIWIFLARRRHLARLREAEDAALAGAPSGAIYGRTNSTRTRTAVLDDEDIDDPHRPTSPMTERSHGGILAAAGLGAGYGSISGNPFDHPDDEGVGERIRGGDSAMASGVNLAAIGRRGSNEADELMKYRSQTELSPIGPDPDYQPPPPRPPRSADRPRTASGPDPAAWLGQKDPRFSGVPESIVIQPDSSGIPAPLPSPQGVSSSEGHGGSQFAHGSSASDMEHLVPASPRFAPYASGSGSKNASGVSMAAAGYESGPGSSAHGHTSSSGHDHNLSSQGHSSSSGGNRASLIGAQLLEGRRSPGPSSLLPSQSQPLSPPTAFRQNTVDSRSSRRKRATVLSNPLKWVRGRPSSSGSSSSASRPQSASEVQLMGDASAPTLSSTDVRSIGSPATIPLAAPVPTPSRRLSITRPQSPVLLSLPPPAFTPPAQTTYETIPENAVPDATAPLVTPPPHHPWTTRMPVWPGLGPLANPDMPSPALTERSSNHAPEGLLDPSLGVRHAGAMQSSAAISLRDEVDYSRPIGGLVNNRMYSSSSIPTTTTMSATRRHSGESGRSTLHTDFPLTTPPLPTPPAS